MPHKRNPVASAVAVAAAVQAPGLVATMVAAMPQEHERAIGGWQAEWDTLPALVTLAARSARAMADSAGAPRRGRGAHACEPRPGGRRGARAEGLVAALAPRVGRGEALAPGGARCAAAPLADGPCAARSARPTSRRFATHLDAAAIVAALDPGNAQRSSRRFVDRVLERWRLGEVVRNTAWTRANVARLACRVRRTVLGDAHVDRAGGRDHDAVHRGVPGPDHPLRLGRDLDAAGLDLRSRRILAIGTMVALGRWEELRMHIRARPLEKAAFTPDDIKEILLQQAVYCGVPAAHRAFAELSAIVAERSPNV